MVAVIDAGVAAAITAQTAQKQLTGMQKFMKYVMNVVKAFQAIAKFLPIIKLVLIILAFFGKPLQFIALALLIVILGTIYVIYLLLDLPGMIWIPLSVWFLIFEGIPFLVYTAFFGALLALVFVTALVLSFINGLTLGALRDIVLCQNTPSSWFKVPNFHKGNKWERGLFCNRPCMAGYSSDQSGLFCEKQKTMEPSFCPQAEATRIFYGHRRDMKPIYPDYQVIGNIKYITSDPEKREQMLKKHYLHKKEFLTACKSGNKYNADLKRYNDIPLSVCSSLDALENRNVNGLNRKDILKLGKTCFQAYCDASSNYPFCNQLQSLNEEDDMTLIKRIIKIMIMVIVFVIVVMFVLNVVNGNF